MANILTDIIDTRRRRIAEAKTRVSPDEMARRAAASEHTVISMSRSIRSHAPMGVIAEFKRRSPSKGWIAAEADPAAVVEGYAASGAAAASVLTEPDFFAGSIDDLLAARAAAPALPILRKDFIIDPYQIDEARAIGADAILLIASALTPADTAALAAHARTLGLEILLELHSEDELPFVAAVCPDMAGINNRRLADFVTDISVAERMADALPGDIVRVSESGVSSETDIDRLCSAGFDAILVGEYLMRGNPFPRL